MAADVQILAIGYIRQWL